MEPGEAGAHGLLLFLVIVGNHEVDELGDTGFARAGRLVAGNDQLREPLDDREVRLGEELRCVRRWTDRRRFGAGHARRRRPSATKPGKWDATAATPMTRRISRR